MIRSLLVHSLFAAALAAGCSIALARGEAGVAERVLRRLLEYDPTFARAADERSPRVERALFGARESAGARPPLLVQTLGLQRTVTRKSTHD